MSFRLRQVLTRRLPADWLFSPTAGFFFLALLLGPSLVQAQSLEVIRLNSEGASLFKEQKYVEAEDKWLQALGQEPLWPVLHMNLALAYEALGQVDKAQSSDQAALKLPSLTVAEKFAIEYNLGELFGKQKNVDQALAHYQEALSLNPDSHETKVNIELLVNGQQSGQDGDQKDQDKKDDKNKDGKDNKDKKDDKDSKDDKDKGQDKKNEQKKEYAKNKPQPQKFKSEDLTQADVNKILGEIKQQEQKIRQDYNREEIKEAPVGKDW